MLLINICLNVVTTTAGSPFYVNGTNNCYYNSTTAPNVDPVVGNTNLQNLNITSSGELYNEAMYPTNSTGIFGGLGNAFNSIYEAGEQLYKMGEVIRAILLGGFVDNVIDNVVFNCYFDTDGNLTSGANSEFWDNLKSGISIVIGVLMVFTVWYHISGRGHLLTS